MEMKEIISATVAVILISIVAIPIIDGIPVWEYQENQTNYILTLEKDNPTISMECTNASTREFSINERTVILPGVSGCVISSAFAINIGSGQAFFASNNNGLIAIATGDKIEVVNGNWTWTPVSGDTISGTLDWIVYPDSNGSYGNYVNREVKVSADSDIYIMGGTGSSTFISSGNVNEQTLNWKTPETASFNVIINKTSIENGLSYSITANFDYTLSSGTSGNSQGYIIAPIKYKAESTGVTAVLIDLLPVLLVVGVVVGIGYSIMRRE